ncbi:MAG: ABC transporter permease, partial [Candidatus Hodarchaeota archaeon]
MNRFIGVVKEYLLDRKFALFAMGALVGLLSFSIILMVDGLDMQQIQNVLAQFPEELFYFLGVDPTELGSPYGFLSLQFLSFMWLYAGIYIVYIASSLTPHEVEEKTIELALSKPITRSSFLGSKITFLFTFILGIMGITFLIATAGVANSQVFMEAGLHLDRLWATFGVVVLFLGALAMIAIFFSTILLNSKRSLTFGIIVFFLMYFLAAFYPYIGDIAKYVSVFSYFNPSEYLV